MRGSIERWFVLLFALAGIVLVAAIIAVSRKGVPFEPLDSIYGWLRIVSKIALLVLLAILGLFERKTAKKETGKGAC